MKSLPILKSAILLIVLIEVVLMILVFIEIGEKRIVYQLTRLSVQLILISWIMIGKSNKALFSLTAYHLITAFLIYYRIEKIDTLGLLTLAYHTFIGLVIYFHDSIETLFGVKSKKG